MFYIFKIFISFSLSFIILSIPINNQKAFYHIDKVLSPFTEIALENLSSGFKVGKKEFVKVFTNSSKETFDKVKTQYSANKKNKQSKVKMNQENNQENLNGIHEKYTNEEEQLLNQVLKSRSQNEN